MSQNIIIGIAGASGSGKSLLASTIVEEIGSYQVVVISEDSYYNDQSDKPMEEREKVNFDHPNAFDHALFKAHLMKLRQGETVQIPIYDFKKHERKAETREVTGSSKIIVLEGILLFVDPDLRKMMDIRLFMDTALDICLLRRLKRDILERGRSLESVFEQYETTVRPMYFQFVEPSKRHADMFVPRGGENRIAIDMIKAKMRELLNSD